MERDFSIRKEIEVEVKENIVILDIDLEQIYNEVECDELMLDVITLSIYSAIQNHLKESNKQNEAVDNKISQLEKSIVKTLMDRGII